MAPRRWGLGKIQFDACGAFRQMNIKTSEPDRAWIRKGGPEITLTPTLCSACNERHTHSISPPELWMILQLPNE